MSSIMRARSGLMGVLLIGVLLVLRPSWWHPHPQARALHIPLTAPIPCSTLRALGSLPQATASAVSFIGTQLRVGRSAKTGPYLSVDRTQGCGTREARPPFVHAPKPTVCC